VEDRENDMDLNREREINRLHHDSIIFDGLLMWGNLDSKKSIREIIDGGVIGANYTIANHSHDFEGAVRNILKYKNVMKENCDLLTLAVTTEDIKKAKNSKKLGIVFGFQDSRAIEEVDYLEVFYALGVRIIQLTYNVQNLAGSGCCEISGGKITYYGQKLIRKMEELGIALDLSHCGYETTESALEFAERPVLFTHVGVRQLCNAYGRAKTDRQFEMLALRGGVAGVCFAPFLVKRNPNTWEVLSSSVKDVVDAIDYLVKLIGIDHVGFGSDMVGAWFDLGKTPPDSSMRLWRELRPDVFGRGPTDVYEPFPIGLQRHSELPNLTKELVERGYSDDNIRKILGLNFLRLLNQIWGS